MRSETSPSCRRPKQRVLAMLEDDATTEDVDESAASVIMAQVDLTEPMIDWTGASLDDLSWNLRERSYELRVTDEQRRFQNSCVTFR